MFSIAAIAKQFIKHAFWVVCLCLTLILFALPSYGLTVKDVPNPQKDSGGWVTDMAQMLSPDAEAKLNQIISGLEGQTGDKIAVVTVPETTPAPSSKAFATRLFNYWGTGKKGVLFLVSKGDRRVEIETGYNIESMLSNAQVSNIIQQEIIPQFRQGNFEEGILTGIQSLVIKLGGNIAVSADTNATTNFNPQSGYVALGILLISSLVLLSFWWFSSISSRNGFIDIGSSSEVGGGDGGGA